MKCLKLFAFFAPLFQVLSLFPIIYKLGWTCVGHVPFWSSVEKYIFNNLLSSAAPAIPLTGVSDFICGGGFIWHSWEIDLGLPSPRRVQTCSPHLPSFRELGPILDRSRIEKFAQCTASYSTFDTGLREI